MSKGSRVLSKYCREVQSWLPCSGIFKRRILSQIWEQGIQILEKNPDADYNTMVSCIGVPKQIAISYIDEMETSELLNNLRIKRKVVRIIAGIAAAVIVIWMCAVGAAMTNDFIQADGRIEIIVDQDTGN